MRDLFGMRFLPALLLVAISIVSTHTLYAESTEVNVYSARKEALIKPLLDRFTEETGVTVNLVTGKGDALLTRLQSEGSKSPADILITTDVGRLHRAEEAGVFQTVDSAALQEVIPANLRDPEGQWYGFSKRARVIVFANDRVKADELSTYEALAEPQWKGRVCIRSSSNIYNQSLVASMIANDGAEKTDEWLQAFVKSFARPPNGGDRDQVKAVAAGQCDVAVVNSYYLGAMLTGSKADQKEAAQKVTLFWPNQNDRGTHVNISGAGVTKSAPNKDNAVKLLEFLATEESQQWYAEVNNEYPVVANIPPSEVLASWGEFKEDTLDVAKLGELNQEAVKAMDRAGWK